ncbi:hypothetical protein RTCIAT899_CH11765 [Rhizobium tropici CIAT 899]|nr:hypothetical protein RTCIAT899_CH11765 [Rhizobium tropici CIAT 899]
MRIVSQAATSLESKKSQPFKSSAVKNITAVIETTGRRLRSLQTMASVTTTDKVEGM